MGKEKSRFWQRPQTKLGWWAVGLALVYLAFYLATMAIIAIRSRLPENNQIGMISFGFSMLLFALAAGITALIAILKKQERSWLVWLSLLPGIFSLFLFIGEFTFPH